MSVPRPWVFVNWGRETATQGMWERGKAGRALKQEWEPGKENRCLSILRAENETVIHTRSLLLHLLVQSSLLVPLGPMPPQPLGLPQCLLAHIFPYPAVLAPLRAVWDAVNSRFSFLSAPRLREAVLTLSSPLPATRLLSTPFTFNFSPDFITFSDTTFWSDLFLVGCTLLRGGEPWSLPEACPATVGTHQVFVGWRPE